MLDSTQTQNPLISSVATVKLSCTACIAVEVLTGTIEGVRIKKPEDSLLRRLEGLRSAQMPEVPIYLSEVFKSGSSIEIFDGRAGMMFGRIWTAIKLQGWGDKGILSLKRWNGFKISGSDDDDLYLRVRWTGEGWLFAEVPPEGRWNPDAFVFFGD